MNTRAMQKGVQQQTGAMDIPIPSEDIVYYLNRAQEKFIEEQYVPLRGKYTDNQNIELYTTAQQAIENLRTVITTDIIGNGNISEVDHFDNAKLFNLDSLTNNFYFYVRSQTQIAQDGQWVNNKLIEQESIQKFIKTKDNDPIFRNNLVLMEGNQIYVFYDSQDSSEVYDVAFTYIKTPAELVLDNPGDGETTESELPRHTHKDLIDLAVVLIARDKGGQNPRLKQQGDD